MDGTLYYQLPVRICIALELLGYYMTHLKNINDLFTLRKYRKSHESGYMIKSNSITDYWMQERPLKYIRLFRDKKLLELIQQLRNNGATIVIYSDYPVVDKLRALKPFPFDFAFCASDTDIQCLKPDTKGIKRILEIIKESVENIVFIGDRYEKDGQCAQRVGMDYMILDKYPVLRNIQLHKKKVSNVE
jgi:FMN phosphatase YigB (HAD superfamily)